MKYTTTVALVLVGTGVIATAALSSRSLHSRPAEGATSRGASSEVAALHAEIDSLREEVAGSRRIANVAALAALRTGAPAASAAPVASVPPPEPMRGPTSAEIRKVANDAFVQETKDVAWASHSEPIVKQDVLRNLPEGSEVGTLECRTSMCRVELVQPGASYQAYARSLVTSTRSWDGPIIVSAKDWGEGERTSVVAYFIKSGEDPIGERWTQQQVSDEGRIQ